MAQFILITFAILCYLIYLGYKKLSTPKVDYVAKLEEANQRIGHFRQQLEISLESAKQQIRDYNELKQKFEKLQFNKISADVKMGQKSENLLPFLSQFPYDPEDVRGLFNPIDLIAFTDEEVVFIEVKTGSAQLSEKQRKIRDNIKAGRVRFEVHRMNEKGVTVK